MTGTDGNGTDRTAGVREVWDAAAASFDDEPDHGLRDPAVAAAWSALLAGTVPPGARVADLGCGTGSLAVLLAAAGHEVTGVDLSPNMLARAAAKARERGVAVTYVEGDAAAPPLPDGGYDAVLVRHVLWALPDPGAALDRWLRLLAPAGRLVLVEGRWSTGSGLPAAHVEALLHDRLPAPGAVTIRPLPEARYWGREIEDERYLAVGRGP